MLTLLRNLIFELGTGRALANARGDDLDLARAHLEIDALAWRLLPPVAAGEHVVAGAPAGDRLAA